MPTVLPQYQLVVDALTPVLHNLPRRVVAVTGPMLSGKTSLGRYLAWHFNVTLIETDLLIVSAVPWRHNLDQLKHMIDVRLGMNRPVIVDGMTSLRLLRAIDIQPDFVVRLGSTETTATGPFGPESAELDLFSVNAPHVNVLLGLE